MVKRLFGMVATFLLLNACASNPDVYERAAHSVMQRPDNPEIDLSEWSKASLPDPGSLSSNQRKVNAVHREPPRIGTTVADSGRCYLEVVLAYNVADNGTPTDIRVFKPSGSPVFDRAAIRALKNWRYEEQRGDEPSGYREDLQTTMSFHGSDGHCQAA